jgi:hypothetical protein
MRFRLRVLILFLCSLFAGQTYSQYLSARLDDLYRYVETTDSLAMRSQKLFYLEKFLKDDYNYKETWRYTTKAGKVVFFQVEYMLDSTEFTEVYYLDRGRLICSEEYETVNHSFRDDRLKFGSILYFESAIPKHIVMLGQRSTYSWRMSDPGDMALSRFSKRFSELKRHMPMLPE